MRQRKDKLNFGLVTFWCGLIMALALGSMPAQAHEIQPAIVDIDFSVENSVSLDIEANVEALIARIGPEHEDTSDAPNASEYDRLRALTPAQLQDAFADFSADFIDGFALTSDEIQITPELVDIEVPAVGDQDLARLSIIRLRADVPPEAVNFVFQWDRAFGTSIVRVQPLTEGQDLYSAYLLEGQASDPLAIVGPTQKSFLGTVIDYIIIGFTHIVPKGLDHILFVIGIYLASTKLRPLLVQVSAFTVAHTVSLALGILGLVTISPSIVEPLIALSIAYVCFENIFFVKMSRWRPFVVFGFGLLHGLGFAGVLSEIGLPPSEFITGLISFNVGVELGQLFVIFVCFALVGYWLGKRPNYRQIVVLPASVLIGAVGLYWFFERIIAA